MPAPAASDATVYLDKVTHEHFCLPRPGEEKPRMEGFIAYTDDEKSGRSRPAMFVTRCLECGAARYRPHTTV